MSSSDMSLISMEDAEAHHNAAERLIAAASSVDEYLEAIGRANNVMARMMMQESAFDINNLPLHTAGLALESIDASDRGKALFEINGRQIITEVDPTEQIETNDILRVVGRGNSVEDAGDFVVPILSGGLLSESVKPGPFDAADGTATVNAGNTADVVTVNVSSESFLLAVGVTDLTETTYQYDIDGGGLFPSRLGSSLGRPGSLYQFKKPIEFNSDLRVNVDNASNNTQKTYTAKVVYLTP